MSSRDAIIANSVRKYPHVYAFDLVLREQMRNIDPSIILKWFIDDAPAALLPVLAEELDVLGIKGWDFADTELKQRSLLKSAIMLRRFKGTVWSIKEIMNHAGFVNPTLTEHSGGHWAKFRISVDINSNTVDVVMLDKVKRLVEEYKNARSVFEGVYFTGNDYNDDTILITDDDLTINTASDFGDTISVHSGLLYNGTVNYDGSRNYSQDLDTITINY